MPSPWLILVQALRAVDERQLLLLLLGILGEFLSLDAPISALPESSRELCTEIHSPRAIDSAPARSPSRPGDQYLPLSHARAGHAHDEAVDRKEPVVGAQGAGPERVAARAMPALEAGHVASRRPFDIPARTEKTARGNALRREPAPSAASTPS